MISVYRNGLMAALLAAVLTGCSTPADEARPEVGATDLQLSVGPPSLDPTPPSDERVTATLGGVALTLEVADDEQEREVGLMDRTSVPPGTGMVFRFDAPTNGRFYMFHVPIPLKAVFISGDKVVSSVVMPPCAEQQPQDCPTYGADGPFDTVVETDPATLPDIAPGDAFAPG